MPLSLCATGICAAAVVNSGDKVKSEYPSMPSAPPTHSPSLVGRLETDEQTAQGVGDLIADRFGGEDVAVSLSDKGGGRWQVAIHFRAPPDQPALRAAVAAAAGPKAAAALKFGRVDATDWVRQSLAGLKPVTAGRFVVHGAHDRARVPFNRIGIEIEAALAFGTGHHGTTRGCLLALDAACKMSNQQRRARRVLDIGTGSGVLAIAAARALRVRVLATDIDGAAVRTARENIRRNRAGGFVALARAGGVGMRTIRARAPFDLILANILLKPLQGIAAPLRQLAARGARVILSGVLPSQANAVIAAYRPLALERRIDIDGWTTLVFARVQRRAVAPPRSAP
jgi:ribosomal protein L11 methyltransferase